MCDALYRAPTSSRPGRDVLRSRLFIGPCKPKRSIDHNEKRSDNDNDNDASANQDGSHHVRTVGIHDPQVVRQGVF